MAARPEKASYWRPQASGVALLVGMGSGFRVYGGILSVRVQGLGVKGKGVQDSGIRVTGQRSRFR